MDRCARWASAARLARLISHATVILSNKPISGQRGIVRFREDRFLVAVIGIVLDERDQLMLFRHSYRPFAPWRLPSGFLQDGETFAESITREIREETGLEIEVDRVLLGEPGRRPQSPSSSALLIDRLGTDGVKARTAQHTADSGDYQQAGQGVGCRIHPEDLSGRRGSNPRNLDFGKVALYQLSYSRMTSILGRRDSLPQLNCCAVRRRWQFTHRTSHLSISTRTLAHRRLTTMAVTAMTFFAGSR